MKKIFCLLLLLAVSFSLSKAQLLWKISGNGLSKPSYVVGTYHFAQGSYADSIPGLKNALDECGQVYGEIEMAQQADAKNVQKTLQAAMLPDSLSLKTLLTTEQLDRFNAFLREYFGDDMGNPAIEAQLGKVKPALLTTQFSAMIYLKKHPNFNPQDLIDAYLQTYAIKKGKPAKGLETFDFQLDLLLGKTPIKRQVEQLMCLIDNKEYNMEVADEVVKAYYAKDLEKIKQAMDKKLNNSCDSSPEEENEMIYNRNANWAFLMPHIMRQSSTLFAVGAGHLPGDKGLLKLLQKQGFVVAPVNK